MRDVEAKVYEPDPDAYRLETNVEESGLSPEELRELGKKALFAVANMNLRIEEMQRHSALPGFISGRGIYLRKEGRTLYASEGATPSR